MTDQRGGVVFLQGNLHHCVMIYPLFILLALETKFAVSFAATSPYD